MKPPLLPLLGAIPGRTFVYFFLVVALLYAEYERRRRAVPEGEKEDAAAAVTGPEPEFRVYDRARLHGDPSRRDDPSSAPGPAAHVYGGVYLAWLVHRGLADGWFLERYAREAEGLRGGTLSPEAAYDRVGGVLGSDLLAAEGRAFTEAYFAPGDPAIRPQYSGDFAACFPAGPAPGDAGAAARLRERLDGRLAAWRDSLPAS